MLALRADFKALDLFGGGLAFVKQKTSEIFRATFARGFVAAGIVTKNLDSPVNAPFFGCTIDIYINPFTLSGFRTLTELIRIMCHCEER